MIGISKFSPDQIRVFRENAEKQIKQEGACEGIDCRDCAGFSEYNGARYCHNNGWKKTYCSDIDPTSVQSCRDFLSKTEHLVNKSTEVEEPVSVPGSVPDVFTDILTILLEDSVAEIDKQITDGKPIDPRKYNVLVWLLNKRKETGGK